MRNITVRVDARLHEQASELFEELGTDLSGAIRMFLVQAVRERAIPFRATANAAGTGFNYQVMSPKEGAYMPAVAQGEGYR
ncbi:MAG: type II toxin-antitoxin system RelB/DinJ family antitoxin [Bacteroidales bacterium]|nr:type II toxin-antitoxin system RelB/DinJ family antitoxin [Bacteroidales bacterium]